MPLRIVRNDITKMKVGAIVNAANQSLLGGGGVDGCIHRAAGPQLLEECRTLGGCETGSAKITDAYRLPCRYVIHAVGPRWRDGRHGEREKLESCYRTSLALAKEHGCETVAFPLISSGIYGYPKDQALKVAVETIGGFLRENDMTVYIVIFDKNAYRISEALFTDLAEYIAVRYEGLHTDARNAGGLPTDERNAEGMPEDGAYGVTYETVPEIIPESLIPETGAATPTDFPQAVSSPRFPKAAAPADFSKATLAPDSLADAVSRLDESFSEMLLRKIDEKGMTDAQCYKKANIDRKLFSKIRSNRLYSPSKPTVLAFAIALEMTLPETREFLMKAGFALSHSNKFDIIVEYFIDRGNYNIFEINEALFAFDQSLLGA